MSSIAILLDTLILIIILDKNIKIYGKNNSKIITMVKVSKY